MSKRKYFFLIGIILISLMLTLPVLGQADGFIVTNADAMTTVAVTGSSNLNSLIASVLPRFVVEHSNGMKFYSMPAISNALQALLGQVSDRFVIEHANADRFYAFAYPVALVNDTTAPLIDSISVEPLGSGSVKITWLTDEFATGTVRLGTQPGVYTRTITDPLYYKQHEVTVTSLIPGAVYYYTVSSTDRSGNTAQSPEHSFIANSSLYLPFLKK